MGEVILTSIVVKLLTALAALLIVWGMFRLLDKGTGHPFSEAMEKMYESPLAVAAYYGLRFVGACLLVGLLLS